ncbi:hypothetical protein ACFL12_00720 [Pseudomonadota bacterium]
MNYLDQFIDALKFLTKFNKEYRDMNPDFEETRQILSSFQKATNEDTYINFRKFIKDFSEAFIQKIPEEHVINKCHAASYSFWSAFQNLEYSDAFSIQITVGNVFYKGENIYNLSKGNLTKIINKGPSRDEALDAHVWVTLEDMTVIDLTIIPTLVHRGLLPKSELDTGRVLIWRECDKSDYSYQPILVDNDFTQRVDETQTVITYP